MKEKSINTKLSKSGIAVVDRKAQKLRSLPRVTALCHKCGGTKAETWSLTLGSEDNSQTTYRKSIIEKLKLILFSSLKVPMIMVNKRGEGDISIGFPIFW